MEKIRAVFFDLDNTLYDTSLLAYRARVNAVNAMIEAGLESTPDEAFKKLLEVVEEYGSNYDRHYNRLLEHLGQKPTVRVIAAGVVAYHETKKAYLVPYPETIPLLLELRQMGLKLGVITDGLPVKQWEKLIRLGLQHFFHTVVVSGYDEPKPSVDVFKKAAAKADVEASECIMVGDKPEKDIKGAKDAGMTAIQLVRDKPVRGKQASVKPDYVIENLKEISEIIKKR